MTDVVVMLVVWILEITGGAEDATTTGVILSVNVLVPVPKTFVALRMTLTVPVEAGAPLIRPSAVLTLRPGGSPNAPKLAGLFEAVI